MARKKRKAPAPAPEWAEQKVIVKRSHPAVQAADGKTPRADRAAELIAERHAKKRAVAKITDDRAYTFITRPKECFREFRGQKRGPHVTVTWGMRKPGAGRSGSCL